MSKKSNIGIVILVLIVLAIAGYLIYTYKDDDSKTENKVNEINNAVVNNTLENNIKNEVESNVVEQNKTDEENQNNENENENKNTEVATEDEKEVAMSIAKEAWGDTDGVYFQMEQTQKPNGDYIISVSADAKVLAWYYVNAQARTYTVEYN